MHEIANFVNICYISLYGKLIKTEVKMNISLTPELEQFVQSKVSSGMYTSASEVIRESLRLLHMHEDLQSQRISQLNQAIEVGLQQLNKSSKVSADESYKRLKKKIDRIAKGAK